MKIALLSEGESEYGAIPVLYPELREMTGNEFLQVIRIPVQPDGPPKKIARVCKSVFKICAAKGVDRVVLILDREQKPDPVGRIAASIDAAIRDHCDFDFDLRVVLKDRSFENWVVADVAALRAQPRRFSVTPRLVNAVTPNKADRADALSLLKAAAIGASYDKKQDAGRTLGKATLAGVAANSRSFRHFLHVVGDPTYQSQCRTPAA